MAFSKIDINKAAAIVSIFETGKPFGDYAACVVLNDGAGVSYGIKQFTHRSGSLLAVVEKYLELGGTIGREMISARLPILKRTTKPAIEKLAADLQFKKALKAAAIAREMREAQDAVAFEKYMRPAVEECERMGFVQPLSLAVVYDSMVHGSWDRIRDRAGVLPEKQWITSYVRLRHLWLRSVPRLKVTSYRTRFFLSQIAIGRWDLAMPMEVHGARLSEELFDKIPSMEIRNSPPATAGGTDKSDHRPATAGGMDKSDHPSANTSLPQPHQTGRDQEVAAPAPEKDGEMGSGGEEERLLDQIEKRVNEVAGTVDQTERIVEAAVTRTDKAKSLWTTIAGTAWQMLWAVGGFLAGVPREVWLVVAIIAGALMLLFLYRQIVMGKERERSEFRGSEFPL